MTEPFIPDEAGGRCERGPTRARTRWREARIALSLSVLLTVLVFQAAPPADAAVIPDASAPTVDGRIDPIYSQSAASVNYTTDSGSPITNGQVSVLETSDAYYIAFQQPFSAKSNAYCDDKDPGCYQSWNSLRGSDFLAVGWCLVGGQMVSPGFNGDWESQDLEQACQQKGGSALFLNVDIIQDVGGGFTGVPDTFDALDRGGPQLTPAGSPGNCITGFSGMHYNMNTAGWTNLDDSPNFAEPPVNKPDYVYASTGEWKVSKTGCGIPAGQSQNMANATAAIAHNSPAAKFGDVPRFISIACPAPGGNVAVNGPQTITATAVSTSGGFSTPLGNQQVGFLVVSGPGAIDVPAANAQGQHVGMTNGAGELTATVRVTAAGQQAVFRAFVDLDTNGIWDPNREPATVPDCPLQAQQQQFNYVCVNATGVTQNAATIGGNTNNPNATQARFVVTPAPAGGQPAAVNLTNGAASTTVSGLTPNTQYTFVVEFLGNNGTVLGSSSAANNCPFTTGAPNYLCVNATGVTQNAATIGGTTTDARATQARFVVSPAPAGGQPAVVNLTNGAASTTVSGLTPNTNYTFEVQFLSNNGTLLGSSQANGCPFTTGTPTYVCVNATAVTQTSAIIGGTTTDARATHARFVMNPAPTGGQPPAVTGNNGSFSTTVNGLTPNTDYTFVVEFMSSANGPVLGQSAQAGCPFKTTPATYVCVPATNVTETSATLRGQTTDSRATQGRFILTPAPTTGQPATVNLTNGSASANVTGLSPSTDYTFVVEFLSSNGTVLGRSATAGCPFKTVTPNIQLTIVKTNDADRNGTYTDDELASAPGNSVPFRAVITNPSTVPVVIDSLTDVYLGVAAFPVCQNLIGQVLPANNGSLTCDFTVDNYAPPFGSNLVNTVTVVGHQQGNAQNTRTAQDTSRVRTPNPVITIDVVKTNDADRNGTYTDDELAPAAGADVPFRAVITNTSAVPIVISSLTDVYQGRPAFDVCNNLIGTVLQPGAANAVTCNFTVTGYAPPASSSLVDTVTVVGHQQGNPNNSATDQDTSRVRTPGVISVSIDKVNDADGNGTFSDDETASAPGNTVPFRAVITNTSTVQVRITSLTDVWAGGSVPSLCANLIGTTLDPGQSVPCTFSVANYAPPFGQQLVNTAAVTVVDVNNPNVTAQDEDTSIVRTPPSQISVSVVKDNDADGDGTFNDAEEADDEGATVPFRAVITNTSNVPVRITSLQDVYAGVAPFGVCANLIGTVLQPGESVTCSFDVQGYAPPAGDTLIDTVTVTVADVNNPGRTASDDDTSTVTTTPTPPEITVEVIKENDADGDGAFNDSETAPNAGAAVPFRAIIRNTSSVPVIVTSLTDIYPGQAEFNVCADVIGTELAPGETVTCTFTVQGYAPTAGTSLVDTVSVTVVDRDNPGNEGSDQDDSTVTTVEVLPLITVQVDKTNDANGDGTFTETETANQAGAAVPFRAVITNTSPVAVVLTAITDVYPGQAAFAVCAELIGTVLQPDESVTCNFTVQGYAPATGSLTDTVRVEATEVDNPDNEGADEDDSTVNPPAPSNIDLTVDKDDAGATFTVGQTGTYTLVVTNVGTTATTGPITVTDTLPTGLTYVNATGTNWSCSNDGQVITCTYTAGALAPGQVAPTITVTVNVGAAAVPQVINPARVTTPNDVNPNNDTDEEPTPVIQVFGNPPIIRQTVQGPPPPTTPLVRTGTDTAPLAGIAILMLLTGAILTWESRRRNGELEVVEQQ